MASMMRALPHLPLLTMAQCVRVFQQAPIPRRILPGLTGYTRMQVLRWFNGQYVRPHSVTLEVVSALAYRAARAHHANRLPASDCRDLQPWLHALNDASYPGPLIATPLITEQRPPHVAA